MYTFEELNKMRRSDLRDLAEGLGLKSISALRKNQIIDVILENAPEDGEPIEIKPRVKRPYHRRTQVAAAAEVTEKNISDEHDDESTQNERTMTEKPVMTGYERRNGYRSGNDDNEGGRRNSVPHYGSYNNYSGGYNNNNGSYNNYGRNNNYNNNNGSNNNSNNNNNNGGNSNGYEQRRSYQIYERHTQRPFINRNYEETNEENETEQKKRERPADAVEICGVLDLKPEGYGFLRFENFAASSNDIYVSPAQIKRFNLKTGDEILGDCRILNEEGKSSPLLFVKKINGDPLEIALKRRPFDKLTPVFPIERLSLETERGVYSTRLIDLISPIGKGQRGMIVAPPKAGKTTIIKDIAGAITKNNPECKLIILLIDERPEEVTDIKKSIDCDVMYSTFDQVPENHCRLSEMVLERACRLVEQKRDVVILLDSITRLVRAYNLTEPPSGRTLSGGLEARALHRPKKFFGAARKIENGGSLTIIATALVETGSRMDDVIFEEFKGTGNMELKLDRYLQERRIYPAIDIPKSGTRREETLLSEGEMQASWTLRRFLEKEGQDNYVKVLNMLKATKNNQAFVEFLNKNKNI